MPFTPSDDGRNRRAGPPRYTAPSPTWLSQSSSMASTHVAVASSHFLMPDECVTPALP